MRHHRASVLGIGLLVSVSLAGCVADSTKSASEIPVTSPIAYMEERMVSLTQAVHFTDAKGQDVVVGPGSYRVDAEGTNRIRLLLAETAEAVVIDAVSFTHQQTVERPVPVTVLDPEQPDVLHLALLSPGGTGLDAIGTYSGVKPRAVTDMMFVTSQIGLQYTAQTSQLAIVSGITAPTTGTMAPAPKVTMPEKAPTTGTMAPPDRYTAPTANLTAVANALQFRNKSLTTQVFIPPGLQVTRLVEISIGFYSPTENNRITQTLGVERGNRFLYNDPEGDGRLRQMRMDISLRELQPGGQVFSFSRQVDLDPLYDVAISPLRFQLLDTCDLIGDADIDLNWFSPDNVKHVRSFGTLQYAQNIINEFTWVRGEVSRAANLRKPKVWFFERDPEFIGFCPDYDSPNPNNLVPGSTRKVDGRLGAQCGSPLGLTCRASVKWTITYTLRLYPYL